MKRLAKLQQIASASSSTSTPSTSPATPPPKPKLTPRPSVSASSQAPSAPSPRPALGLTKKKTVAKLDLADWEHESIGSILKVTLEVFFVFLVFMRLNTYTPVCFSNKWLRKAVTRLYGSSTLLWSWNQKASVSQFVHTSNYTNLYIPLSSNKTYY